MIQIETLNTIDIKKTEVLRYLGYGKSNADANVSSIIDKIIIEMKQKLSLRSCYDKYPVSVAEDDSLCFGSIKTNSRSLKKNLHGCDEVLIFTATIGVDIDRIIGKYNMLSPSHAVVAQAVGATLIEEWCDVLCSRFSENEKSENKVFRPRFSPGYGDFPLEMQKKIFEMLDCPRKIGVSLTDSLLMVPSKSVSAIIGICKDNHCCKKSGCEICKNINCEYRR